MSSLIIKEGLKEEEAGFEMILVGLLGSNIFLIKSRFIFVT